MTDKLFFVQLLSMVIISFGQISYLVYFKPFEEPLLLKLDIFNEFTTIILVDLLTCFSGANTKPLDFEMDIFFLVGLFGNIAVHLYFLVKNSVVGLKQSCKRKCCQKKVVKYPVLPPKQNKHQQIPELELEVISEEKEFEQSDYSDENSAKEAKLESISSLSISQESQGSKRGDLENNVGVMLESTAKKAINADKVLDLDDIQELKESSILEFERMQKEIRLANSLLDSYSAGKVDYNQN